MDKLVTQRGYQSLEAFVNDCFRVLKARASDTGLEALLWVNALGRLGLQERMVNETLRPAVGHTLLHFVERRTPDGELYWERNRRRFLDALVVAQRALADRSNADALDEVEILTSLSTDRRGALTYSHRWRPQSPQGAAALFLAAKRSFRTKRCAYPTCRVEFVPTSHERFCGPEHRLLKQRADTNKRVKQWKAANRAAAGA